MADIPVGDATKGAKIFKTKCAQCHSVEKVGGVGKCQDHIHFSFGQMPHIHAVMDLLKEQVMHKPLTTVIVFLRPELLEICLALTSVNYHRNV